MVKGLKLKSRFKKIRSKAAAEADENDDFQYSQDVNSDTSDKEDGFFRQHSKSRFGLERTWSVNALQISTHSTGNVYIDESDSDENDSDDSSSYASFGSESSDDKDDLYTDDDEDDNSTDEMTNETKVDETKKTKTQKPHYTRRFNVERYKKQARGSGDFAPEMIPEGDEDDDEFEDVSENESNDNSGPRYQTPASLTKQPRADQHSLDDPKVLESGYSSDSASVRKRMALVQEQQQAARKKEDAEQSSNEGKKKKGRKKKQSSREKKKRTGTKNQSERSGGGSLEGDSTVTTISVESEEETRQSNDTKVQKNGKKKKKKKKKKKNGKDTKKERKRVISFVVDGDDDACADFDKRLEEIEHFEAALVEERKLIQKERETMAFERESMEMRLDEESRHVDDLNSRIRELEQLVQSQKLSNAGDDAESINEKLSLKREFAREKREFHLQLVEKEREIDRLEVALKDLKILQASTENGEDKSFDSNNGDSKSRERLQGELLQTVAKLSEKETELKSQSAELESVRQELASLKNNDGSSELKRLLASSQEDKKRLQQELDSERKEMAKKMKDKDETVTFLMNELARLKQSKGR